jgi:pyruvate/2-oxoglutarate dehydrogenase complex dihydrolipoamide acyltransferase (E2) component
MPNLGAASDEARLVSWLVQEGDRVVVGQPIYEVETDKSLMTVEATDNGQIGRLLVEAGETVAIGAPIAEFWSEREFGETADLLTEPPAIHGPTHGPPLPSSRAESIQGREGGTRANVSPRARRLAARLGIDSTTLSGTGPGGLVSEADVNAAAAARQGRTSLPAAQDEGGRAAVVGPPGPPQASSSPVVNAFDPLVGLSGARAIIARRMSASSQETAAVTLTCEAEAGGLLAAVSNLRAGHPEVSAGITLDLLVARCVARSLQEHPQLNASLTPAGLVIHDRIDVGIALDAETGLIVAVLRDAATRPLLELAQSWGELRARALAGTATPAELAGGTFTITNLGHLGVGFFTPIINPGEAAILGIGRVSERPVVREGKVVPARTMLLSLTFDHRIVDGGPAARFLHRVCDMIEHPDTAQ